MTVWERASHRFEPSLSAWLLVALLSIAAGALIALRPEDWIIVVAPFVGGALLLSPVARLAFVVLVGIVVLGPPEFTTAKALYFGGVMVCAVASSQNVLHGWGRLPREVRRLLTCSLIGLVLLAVVATYRVLSGVDAISVLRDFAPYVLFAIAPLVAVDAGSTQSLPLLRMLAALGLALGSLGYLASWAARRGILADVGPITAFGAFSMPVALLVLAGVSLIATGSGKRGLWALLAGFALGTMILTGTRSFLLVAPAVLAAVAWSTPSGAARVRRLIGAIAVVATATVLVISVGVAVGGLDFATVAGRWSLVTSAIADPAADQSIAMRIAQTDVAVRLFAANPLFGVATGLGTAYTAAGNSYTSDTPVALLADFGLVGVGAVLAVLTGWLSIARPKPIVEQNAWPRSAVIGMVLAALSLALIGPVVQDKGLGFSFLVLGAPLIRTRIDVSESSHDQVLIGQLAA